MTVTMFCYSSLSNYIPRRDDKAMTKPRKAESAKAFLHGMPFPFTLTSSIPPYIFFFSATDLRPSNILCVFRLQLFNIIIYCFYPIHLEERHIKCKVLRIWWDQSFPPPPKYPLLMMPQLFTGTLVVRSLLCPNPK